MDTRYGHHRPTCLSAIAAIILACGLPVLHCGCKAEKTDESRSDLEKSVVAGKPRRSVPLPPEVANAVWLTDFKRAAAISEKTGLPILVDFTGKDWCPPCQALKQRVFESEEFEDWASENVVLLELDYPRTTRPSEQKLQMQRKYGIRGYPTVLFLNAEGKEIGRARQYGGEQAKQWIAGVQNFVK